MSTIRRVGVVLLSHLGLLLLLVLLQSVGAVDEKAAATKEKKELAKEEKTDAKDKDKAPAKDKKDDAKDKDKKSDAKDKDKAKDKKDDAKDKDKKTEAKEEKAAVAKPAAGAAAKAAPMKPAAAPPIPPGPETEQLTDAITLPTDRQIKRKLEAAHDYIVASIRNPKDADWGRACGMVQTILDAPEDVFVQVTRENDKKEKRTRWVSARAEASQLIGKMPQEGLETYQLKFGNKGKDLLDKAKKEGDPVLLAKVVLSYFHTDAGIEATDLLGTYYLDRGQPMAAALCYDRLLQRHGTDQLAALTLYKAAYAFRAAGDAHNLAASKKIWQRLVAQVGQDGFRIDGEMVALDQLQKEMDTNGNIHGLLAYDWPMFRGNASRSGQGRGSAPFLRSKWAKSNLLTENEPDTDNVLSSETKNWIERALTHPTTRKDLMIPAFFPVATGGKLIYRNYCGISARDIRTGELIWDSLTLASLDSLIRDQNKRQTVTQWMSNYMIAGTQSILFENSTAGTLSTDDLRVYAVDDLALAPHPSQQEIQMMMWGNQTGINTSGVGDLAQRSRLIAIELESGKLVWERGDPAKDTIEATQNCYFLGAPLPLGNKLYVLADKNSELLLLCLDAQKGELVWSQKLATTKDKMLMDPARRAQAVHLAYADGILVCPTNAGAILGVDMLSRSLAWAVPYREKPKTTQPDNNQGMRRFGGMGGGQEWGGNLAKFGEAWKLNSPILVDGKVIFTAADGDGIHCISLYDGEPLWKAPRGKDDVYVAGVYGGKVILVGKNSCRALSLEDGKKQLWEARTDGAPTGQGAICGRYYYLPIRKDKNPKYAVCKVNLETGKIDGSSPAPDNEAPGNLLFYEMPGNIEGSVVISQNEKGITCYQQVDARIAQINTLLEKNPRDPVALASRGEMRLYDGKLPEAVADLHAALENNPPASLLPETRSRLYTTLTELMRLNFKEAKKYLHEYKDLSRVVIPADATPEQRQKLEAEQRRRDADYFCLFAQGCEDEGKLVDAFRAYLDFGALADSEKMLPIFNEPHVMARPEVWARGRIAGLVEKADAEQLKVLETEVAKKWQSVRESKDAAALPRFVQTFGPLFTFAAAREAHVQLARRAMEQDNLVEAELLLQQLRTQQADRQTSAWAVDALAQLMTSKHLLDDATYYYRILGRDFADVVLHDGKTAAEICQDLQTDKRFVPYLEQLASPWAGARIQVLKMDTGSSPNEQIIHFDARGEQLPFFKNHRLAWVQVSPSGSTCFQFRLLDRENDRELWSITAPSARAFFNPYGSPGGGRFPYYSRGHFAVLYLGHMIYGFDLATKKVLWTRDLIGEHRMLESSPYGNQHSISLDKDGSLLLTSPQGTIERTGQIVAVTDSYVCLRTAEGLIGIDPVKSVVKEKDKDKLPEPVVLWTKSDVASSTQVFGDEQYIYLVDIRDDKSISGTRALRGRDGAEVKFPDFATAYKRHQRLLGSRLLVSENDPTGGLVLRLYDVPSGKNLWKKTLAPNALVLRAEDPQLLGIVERTGKVTVVDLGTQTEVFHAAVDVAHLSKVNDGLLLRDGGHYYVTLNRPPEPVVNNNVMNGQMIFWNGGWNGGVAPNYTGLRQDTINGTFYAFNRRTKEDFWFIQLEDQRLLLQEFEELPVVLFTVERVKPLQNNNFGRGGPPGGFQKISATVSVDKRTGKRIWDQEVTSGTPAQQPAAFYALKIDRRRGWFDLVSTNQTLRHYTGELPPREQLQPGVRQANKETLDSIRLRGRVHVRESAP